MKKFNDWLAIKITAGVGSMWCAYIFAGIACVSLPAAISTGDPIVIVSWIAQTFLQLVLLSIILKGQNIQSDQLESVINQMASMVKQMDEMMKRMDVNIEIIKTDEEIRLVDPE